MRRGKKKEKEGGKKKNLPPLVVVTGGRGGKKKVVIGGRFYHFRKRGGGGSGRRSLLSYLTFHAKEMGGKEKPSKRERAITIPLQRHTDASTIRKRGRKEGGRKRKKETKGQSPFPKG